MINREIILITGGQRSGKSAYAERLALKLSDNPVYLATSRIWDEEFRRRVEKHKEGRGNEWTNIEEDKYIGKLDLSGRVVVIDCVTLWCTNFFFDNDGNVDVSLEQVKKEFDSFINQSGTFIFITNEIGSGGIPADTVQRKFTDLQGLMNQYIASVADKVTLLVSGIPCKIKE